MKKKRTTTRRQFVKQTAIAGLGAAVASCASTEGLRKIASIEGGDDFDYVVVGSGAGGGPVAVNLAKAGYRVRLLEAGDKYPVDKNHRNYEIPALHPFAVEDPAMRWDFFVNHYADPAKQMLDSKYIPGKGILYPRAGTLGGCTAHNALITLYPDNKDWDDIANLFGDKSWASSNMRTYYQRLENAGGFKGASERRGTNGWLGVEETNLAVRLKDWDWKMHTVAEAAAGGWAAADLGSLLKIHDPNDWSYVMNKYEGAFNIPKATSGSRRNGTRELILAALEKYPNNLILSTNSFATKVLFDSENRAVGIEFLEGAHLYSADPNSGATSGAGGVRRQVRVKKEVILSGGAFNSPQLLMLSGVGPRAELTKHGIEVRVDRPGVGRNLQDRYEVGVVTKMKEQFGILDRCNGGQVNDPCADDFEANPGSSIYSSNGPIVSLLKKSDPKRANPDLVVFALPGMFRGYYPGWSKDCVKKDYLTWAILKGHTKNTSGTVTLKSADPLATPEINFNYFDEGTDPNGEDLNAVLKGIEFARGVNNRGMVKKFLQNEELPVAQGEDLKNFVKKEAWGHHASCSNKMGVDSDPMAVLDNKFRVRGTKGLRVVDASVFPRVPGLFIVVPIYMIAEKASDDILADAKA
jgi:choline dehydrogenase